MNDKRKVIKSEVPQYFYEESAISFIDILLILSKHIRIILIVPSIICTIAIFYVLFIAAPAYTSSAKILSGKSSSSGQMGGLAAQFGIRINPTGNQETDLLITEVLKSRSLARKVLKRKVVLETSAKEITLLQLLTNINGDSEKPLSILEMDAVDIFLNQVEISEDMTTGVIRVSLTASEKVLSYQILNILIEELGLYQQNYNKAKTSKTRKFIEERIKETEKDLVKSEENLKDFMDRNRRIQNSPALQLQRDRLSREVSVLTGVFTTLKQQYETTKIEEVKDSDYVIVIDPPEIPQNRSAPQRTKIVVFSGIFGIILGLIFAVMKNYFGTFSKKERKELSLVLENILYNLKITDLKKILFKN